MTDSFETVSHIYRSKGSEIDYNLLNIQFMTTYTIELECILNGLLWQRFMLSQCFEFIIYKPKAIKV